MTDLLADHSLAGRETEGNGASCLFVVLLPCLVIYRLSGGSVVVRFVRYAAQSPSGLSDG